jgi:hypothetical protein
MVVQHIQNKYHNQPRSGSNHPITLNEIEESLEELFTIGAGLIIQMLEAELQMMDGKTNGEKMN